MTFWTVRKSESYLRSEGRKFQCKPFTRSFTPDSLWKGMRSLPDLSLAAIIWLADSELRASGFSQTTVSWSAQLSRDTDRAVWILTILAGEESGFGDGGMRVILSSDNDQFNILVGYKIL